MFGPFILIPTNQHVKLKTRESKSHFWELQKFSATQILKIFQIEPITFGHPLVIP